MPATKITLDYDGTRFAGWARQPGLRTVQGALEAALAQVRGNRPVDVTVAGRTDRGVHAWAQVVSYPDVPVSGDVLKFWVEADSFMRHMNRVLVGTMLEVAGGRRSTEDFGALLTGRPRAAAGPTAPPHGLYFAGVAY